MPARPKKETVSKALSDLGLVEKLIKDIETIVGDIQKSVLTTGNFTKSIELSHVLLGQLTMAKALRRMLSAQVGSDYSNKDNKE